MSRVITFSRRFPAYHPKKGESTRFVEALVNSFHSLGYAIEEIDELCLDSIGLDEAVKNCKSHTIRAGNRWKVGDKFSPRVWSGKPYASKQIVLAEDIEIKSVFNFKVEFDEAITFIYVNNRAFYSENRFYETDFEDLERLALNDGVSVEDLKAWLKYPSDFNGQIICWNTEILY